MTTKVIYKYSLGLASTTVVNLPKGAKLLSVQFQNEKLCLWAEVDLLTEEFESVCLFVHGTGHPFDHDPSKEYFCTVQDCGFVWHIYRKVDKHWPDQLHPSHETVSTDASTYDERCIYCGATDIAGGDWGELSKPCTRE